MPLHGRRRTSCFRHGAHTTVGVARHAFRLFLYLAYGLGLRVIRSAFLLPVRSASHQPRREEKPSLKVNSRRFTHASRYIRDFDNVSNKIICNK
ncbi:hypothetical protein AVEN_80595-1 [Araneus ventricosus]|uniref:Uncharacterized protein n=1 Tax=Araneus ventricosus TaxID=182803 RepID=A0A4Y2M2V5_ARAVE|nr:hypothetical protein AVEN_80595-1 [Araneus ventricosus]